MQRAIALAAVLGAAALPARAGPIDCALAGVDDRCEAWVAVYNHPGNQGPEAFGYDEMTDMAMSPDGSRIYATGRSYDDNAVDLDYATAAFETATGKQLWASRYNGPTNDWDAAYALRVGPDGERVFVTGIRDFQAEAAGDYATIAYDADTGAQLWLSTYNGTGNKVDAAYEMAVAPDGSAVYVAGVSRGVDTEYDYGVAAYDAATGAELWTARYGGAGREHVTAVATSPDGSLLYLTGLGWVTVALWTADDPDADRPHRAGDVAWVGSAVPEGFVADELAPAPDGRTLFATGGGESEVLTVAYDTATGLQRWAADYASPSGGYNSGQSLGLSPSGDRVFVGGTIGGAQVNQERDFAVLAYDAATGQRRWAARHGFPGYGLENAEGLAVSPDGGRIYVTGVSAARATLVADIQTLALNASNGGRAWVARYNPGPAGVLAGNLAFYMDVTPDSKRVVVGGTFGYLVDTQQPNQTQGGNYHDFGLLAYDAA